MSVIPLGGVRVLTAVTALAAVSALVQVGTTVPAAAGVPGFGSEFSGNLVGKGWGTGPAGCVMDPGDVAPRRAVAGAGRPIAGAESRSRLVRAGTGAKAALMVSETSAGITPVLRGGALSSLTAQGTGTVEFWPSGNGVCGDASKNLASATSRAAVSTVQPIRGAGWLRLNMENNAAAPAQLTVVVWDGTGRMVTQHRGTAVGHRKSLRVFLPRNGRVQVSGTAGANLLVRSPLTKLTEASWSMKMNGMVTPIGVALASQRGADRARRAVALPAQANCRTGKAWVAVARHGKKHAREITLRVQGKSVRVVKKPAVRSYAVSVPNRGAFRVKAQVKLKSGVRVTTSRRYEACS